MFIFVYDIIINIIFKDIQLKIFLEATIITITIFNHYYSTYCIWDKGILLKIFNIIIIHYHYYFKLLSL